MKVYLLVEETRFTPLNIRIYQSQQDAVQECDRLNALNKYSSENQTHYYVEEHTVIASSQVVNDLEELIGNSPYFF